MKVNKYPRFKIEEKNSQFFIYRFESPNFKDLIWVVNTRQEAEYRINQKIISLKDKSGQKKVNLNKKAFKKINEIYREETK